MLPVGQKGEKMETWLSSKNITWINVSRLHHYILLFLIAFFPTTDRTRKIIHNYRLPDLTHFPTQNNSYPQR